MKHDLQLLEVDLDHEVETTEHEFVSEEASWAPIHAYHEMADVPVKEVDLFESIEHNLATLEDMTARMRFMVREVKYLLKA